jgi:chemotaxis protein CheZ
VTTISGSFNPEQIIVDRLQAKTAELHQCLANHDVAGAFSVIEHINAAKEESIYYGLGMLARGLHTAIVTFQVDDHGKAYLKHDEHGAAPITNQLDNVIKMSEESARKTLNILDGSMPMVRELRENLARFETDGGDPQVLAAEQRAGLERLEQNLMEILMAQGFQDLSGQAIRKVNNILETLQKDLISLLTYANQVKSMSEPVPVQIPVMGELGEAEQAPPEQEEHKDAAMEQASVDDLLASLGF